MPSAVGICSNALLQLGDEPIASFTENTKRARLCSNLWPQVRDDILRKHPWRCAQKRVLLAPEATAPAFDWAYSFLLPGDWIRTVQVGERCERLDFETEGNRILANVAQLSLVYTAQVTDPTQWDDALADAACAEMVARLAYPITQSASLAELKRREASLALKVAKALSGQDNPPEDWADSPFIDVRG